jgi:hypothetical protein
MSACRLATVERTCGVNAIALGARTAMLTNDA